MMLMLDRNLLGKKSIHKEAEANALIGIGVCNITIHLCSVYFCTIYSLDLGFNVSFALLYFNLTVLYGRYAASLNVPVPVHALSHLG
jgi:hypothetical protein